MPVSEQGVLLTGDTMTGDLVVPNLWVPGSGLITMGGDATLRRVAAAILASAGPLRAERVAMTSQYLQLDGGDSSGARLTAEFGSQKYLRINNNGVAGVVSTASIQFALGDVLGLALVAGDKLLFGAAQDTDLYRAAAGRLASTSRLDLLRSAASYSGVLQNPNAAGFGWLTQVGAASCAAYAAGLTGETANRWYVGGDGKQYWGPGGVADPDTDLYRAGAGILASSSRLDLLRSASGYSGILTNPNAAGHGWNITLGTATSVLLRGQVSGDAGYRFLLDANGTMWWGPGTAGYDVFLYRVGAGALRTDGKLTVAGGLYTPISTKTADYALAATDDVILANATMTATLPSAVTSGAGRRFTVKNIHASAICTLASAAGNIDGAATMAIGPLESVTAVTDGANWWAI